MAVTYILRVVAGYKAFVASFYYRYPKELRDERADEKSLILSGMAQNSSFLSSQSYFIKSEVLVQRSGITVVRS